MFHRKQQQQQLREDQADFISSSLVAGDKFIGRQAEEPSSEQDPRGAELTRPGGDDWQRPGKLAGGARRAKRAARSSSSVRDTKTNKQQQVELNGASCHPERAECTASDNGHIRPELVTDEKQQLLYGAPADIGLSSVCGQLLTLVCGLLVLLYLVDFAQRQMTNLLTKILGGSGPGNEQRRRSLVSPNQSAGSSTLIRNDNLPAGNLALSHSSSTLNLPSQSSRLPPQTSPSSPSPSSSSSTHRRASRNSIQSLFNVLTAAVTSSSSSPSSSSGPGGAGGSGCGAGPGNNNGNLSNGNHWHLSLHSSLWPPRAAPLGPFKLCTQRRWAREVSLANVVLVVVVHQGKRNLVGAIKMQPSRLMKNPPNQRSSPLPSQAEVRL